MGKSEDRAISETRDRTPGNAFIAEGLPRYTAIAFVVGLFYLGIERFEGIGGTQLTYFPQALRIAGVSSMAEDWFANTTPTHLAYSAYAAVFQYLGILQLACNIGAYILLGCGLAAVYLQALWIFDTGHERGWKFTGLLGRHDFAILGLLAIVGAFHLRHLLHLYTGEPLRMGFAYQNVPLIVLFENTAFALVIYLGISLLPQERYRAAGICFGIAAVFHASYFLHCCAIVVFVGLWLMRKRRVAEILRLAIPFALLTAPFIAYAVWLRFGGSPEASGVMERLAHERIAHHVFPDIWWRRRADWALVAILVTTSCLLLWYTRGPLSWVYALSTAYVLGGIAFVYHTGNVDIGLFFPWRAGSYLIPAGCVLLLLGALTMLLTGLGRLRPALRPKGVKLMAAGLSIVALLFAGFLADRTVRRADQEYLSGAFAHAVHDVTTPQDTIVIPSHWMGFRVTAMRAIYVDQKSHPFRRDELSEWFRRLENNNAFFDLPVDDRLARCAELGASHYADQLEQGEADPAKPALAIDDFRLYKCPRQI